MKKKIYNRPLSSARRKSKGFSIIEILVSIALITILSFLTLSSFGPWLDFRAKLETEQRLKDLQTLLSSAYDQNARRIDSNANLPWLLRDSVTLTPSVVSAEGVCNSQSETLGLLQEYAPLSGVGDGRDGYGGDVCILMARPRMVNYQGSQLPQRIVALVSPGKNGVLDSASPLDSETGRLTLEGDDMGVIISGLSIHQRKVELIEAKLNRISNAYETYYALRFQSNAQRDVRLNYFIDENNTDSSAVVPQAQNPTRVDSVLGAIGVGEQDAIGPYESGIENFIYVKNASGSNPLYAGVRVKSDGLPPFTAALAYQVPNQGGSVPTYIARTVFSNY